MNKEELLKKSFLELQGMAKKSNVTYEGDEKEELIDLIIKAYEAEKQDQIETDKLTAKKEAEEELKKEAEAEAKAEIEAVEKAEAEEAKKILKEKAKQKLLKQKEEAKYYQVEITSGAQFDQATGKPAKSRLKPFKVFYSLKDINVRIANRKGLGHSFKVLHSPLGKADSKAVEAKFNAK